MNSILNSFLKNSDSNRLKLTYCNEMKRCKKPSNKTKIYYFINGLMDAPISFFVSQKAISPYSQGLR